MPSFPTLCSQHPPRSLGGSGGSLCTPGWLQTSPMLLETQGEPKEPGRGQKEHSQGICCLWGWVPQRICSCGLGPGCSWLPEPKLHPAHVCRIPVPIPAWLKGCFFPIKHVALAEGVLGAGGAPCSHPQQRCQEQPEPKPTGLGFPRELHNLEPWLGSLGFPTELRNRQSPEDELPGSSQQLHRGEISPLHFPGRNILQE